MLPKIYWKKTHRWFAVHCALRNEQWFDDKGGIHLENIYHCKQYNNEKTEIKKMRKENNMSPMGHENAIARNELKYLQHIFLNLHTK